MKKFYILAVLIIILSGLFIALRGKEDTWTCQEGYWVKHGNPSTQKPTGYCR